MRKVSTRPLGASDFFFRKPILEFSDRSSSLSTAPKKRKFESEFLLEPKLGDAKLQAKDLSIRQKTTTQKNLSNFTMGHNF
jgi:hypothetical protein